MSRHAIIKDGKIIYSDTAAGIQKPNEFSAAHLRQAQKKQFQRELTQPTEVGFGRAYPEKAREMYGDDTYRLIS